MQTHPFRYFAQQMHTKKNLHIQTNKMQPFDEWTKWKKNKHHGETRETKLYMPRPKQAIVKVEERKRNKNTNKK